MLSVAFSAETVRPIPGFKVRAHAMLRRAAKRMKLADVAVDVTFVSDRRIKKLNKNFREVDTPTDVLSFAMRESMSFPGLGKETEHLGEIFINADDLRRRAKKLHERQTDIALFLLVHGFLHLVGFDHANKKGEDHMRKLEAELCGSHVYYDHS